MKRVIYASYDISEKMKKLKKERIDVYSFFPIDKGDCECNKMIREWKDKLTLMNDKDRENTMLQIKNLTCPKDKTDMKQYTIICKNCDEIQGYCYASNSNLEDFCDFHYVSWTDGVQWFGCFTPNISPITQQLTLECACGQDTRDFRANQTLATKTVIELEEKAKEGREFGTNESKFNVQWLK